MAYRLGIDLGSAVTTAAVSLDGAPPQLFGLGDLGPQLGSVVFVAADGALLVGVEAERLGEQDPTRLARNFKPRGGDGVPVRVGAEAIAPDTLSTALLRHVVRTVVDQQGGAPAEIVLSHPAEWDDYRLELFAAAAAAAEVGAVQLCTEAEAAATMYATEHRLEPGARILVYDLGASFHVCVLERTSDGFSVLGTPGGADDTAGNGFDEAVDRLVRGSVGERLRELDPLEPDVGARLARLRRDCVRAKEVLSTDLQTSVEVDLPGLRTTVRLSRSELVSLIRPSLRQTLALATRTLQAASLQPADLTSILLLGGSSRIPAVAELLHRELDVAFAPDVHPTYDTALGSLLVGKPAVTEGTPMTAVAAPAQPTEDVRLPIPVPPETATTAPSRPPDSTVALPPLDDARTPAPRRLVPALVATPATASLVAGGSVAAGPAAAAPAEPRRAQASWSPASPGQGPYRPDQGGSSPSGYQGGPPPGPGQPTPRYPGGPGRPGGIPPAPPGPGEPSGGAGRRLLVIAAVGLLALALLAGIGVLVVRAVRAPGTAADPPTATSSAPPVPPTSAPATSTPTVTGSAPPTAQTSPTSNVPPQSPALPASAALPPDTVVAPLRLDGERDLYLVDTRKRAKPVRLPSPDGADGNPVLQPQRTSIVYLNEGQLRVMAADGTGDRLLFDEAPKGCEDVRHVVWSTADANVLVLQCVSDEDEYFLQTVDLAGQVVKRLAISKERIEDPSLSTDGQTIVYWASDDPDLDGGSIYTIPIDGSEQPTRLTREPAGTDADPAWSPDGSQIAFRRRDANGSKNGDLNVYLMNFDGSEQEALAQTPASDFKPVWSPDGTQLLIISNRKSAVGGRADTYDLWLTRTEDGRVLRAYGLRAEQITTPFWSHR